MTPFTIVNVDDYAIARYARSQILRQAGFEVAEAASGAAALDLVTSTCPELVILDVNLPDMSGLEVCRRLKTDPRTAAIPVLHVSSTYVDAQHHAVALDTGADGYLTEPADPTVLVATIKALLRARRAEEAARRAARDWQVTFDAIGDGVALLDPSGGIVRCNQAFAGLFGIASADLIGRDVRTLWDVPFDASAELPFSRLLRSRQRESAVLAHQGRWFAVSADPLEDGGAVYIVGDVSARHLAEQERAALTESERDARAAAEAASRTKDDFFSTLSHELRTPLNVVLGWLNMLRSGRLDAARSQHALDTIDRNVKLQARLVDELLEMSRVLSGKLYIEPEVVNLATVVELSLEALRPAAEAKAIDLVSVLDRAADPILADPRRLQQVVWNLVSNAVKFTPRGGRVEVRLERRASSLVLTVSDTGGGIDPELLPRVFERFWQADSSSRRQHAGLGLGLAIVRHLVELHGGTVRAHSAGVGQGATFTVELPSNGRELRTDSVPGASVALAEQRLRGVRVLVVDDTHDTRDLLTFGLALEGGEIQAVGSVQEALPRLDDFDPDVIVCDLGLPGTDGFACLRAVRERPPGAGRPILAIALTGFASEQQQRDALAAGYEAYLVKPVEPDALVAAIARVVRRPR